MKNDGTTDCFTVLCMLPQALEERAMKYYIQMYIFSKYLYIYNVCDTVRMWQREPRVIAF